ncbi:DMP19 family protein [Aliiruegeria sabulilitoris]|uniref:DMP19 family protein n=1 Tax=Aliiruegeria sabulilitoris TaxID=1510458 RepID=UPI0012E36837|nr:hypothetical protein [Aliiruegeria sabulilitoris]NDR59468.1 hypothetical protein [Pseudoruegeria sp. M32A2M]
MTPTQRTFEPVIVRSCSIRSIATDPGALVADISSHVSVLTEKARYRREDFPAEALQLYHADLYRREVNTWGHAGFIGRSQQSLADALSDSGKALRACGADRYRDLFEKMQTWIALNPEDAADLTGEDEDEAPELTRLDHQFQALEAEGLLVSALAEWIITQPWLEVVDDSDFGRAQRRAITKARRRRGSGIAETIAEIDHFLSNPANVGFGMAAASRQTPEPVIHIGCVQHLTTGPDKIAPARWMRTVAGERFGVLIEEGFALFEAVPERPQAAAPGPSLAELRRLRYDRIDEILFHYPHKLGKRLAVTPTSRAKLAIQVCHHLHAACAIHLLLDSLAEPATLTSASVHSIGKADDGGLKAVVMIVADDATRAFSAMLDNTGATLLSEPDHRILGQIDHTQIETQQKMLRTA